MASAQLIADTISPWGERITTLRVTFWRAILAELNTHRVICKSVASSRAIPLAKRIEEVRDHPFIPSSFTRNKPGMSADEVLTGDEAEQARLIWIAAARNAARSAEHLGDLKVHKQHAARLLEPYLSCTAIITATDWDNFFKLRISPFAQPEFMHLATLIRDVMSAYEPTPSTVHLPFADSLEVTHTEEERFNISAARCARTSYQSNVTKIFSNYEEDLKLATNLLEQGHMSPFEHAAKAIAPPGSPGFTERAPGPYYGWVTRRSMIEPVQSRRW